ncbi:hypothetical protein [Cellulomonas sp. Y8]|uniref:hypothetical protein n=1 Tax=Cellulomonas sp. Y8 TaxID=2591145 RepID=UPI0011CA0867|nr:hypothetical protein [Cellulomonas sp. Y8]
MGARIADLQLVWPRELFVQELQAATQRIEDPWGGGSASYTYSQERLDLLFSEAFYDDTGTQWLADAREERALQTLVDGIRANPALVPVFTRPVLYRDRHGRTPAPAEKPRLTFVELQARLGELIGELDGAGYFDSALGEDCVDSENDHQKRGRDRLSDLMGSREEWPPSLLISSVDHTYTVVEAVYYLAARPRQRSYHSYGREWHYSDFDRRAGQAVYRWRVNALLEESDSLLRLDTDGVLVETTGDPRDELLETLAGDDEAPAPDALRHAIDQFRRRGATREDKRSAVVALAGILESHRQLLRDELLSQDENSLFNIANNYAIRHHRAGQRDDYDDAFLDWIFWWYLATVALTKQLIARGPATPAHPQS